MTRRILLAACAIVALTVTALGQNGAVRVGGAVTRPAAISRDEIAAMPHISVMVPGRGQSDRYDGVPLIELLKRAGATTGDALRGQELAKYVVVTGADGFRVVFAMAELDAAFTDRVVLLADKLNGAALPENALPYRLIIPDDKRPTRSVRQVVAVDVLEAPKTP